MIFDKKKLRYIVAGAVNTIFGYLVGVQLYKILFLDFHILLIGILINIINISFSFITYKIFVFETRDGWILEYLKSYITYGISAIVGVSLLWGMISIMDLSIWYAQAYSMVLVAILSYFGHNHFTFKKSINNYYNK